MRRSRLLVYGMLGLFALVTSGCLEAIAYAPQPAKVADPQHQLDDTVTTGGSSDLQPPLKVEVTDAYLKIIRKVPAPGGGETLDTQVLPFANVADMKLSKGSGTFVVIVSDAAGGRLFTFFAKDLPAAQRFMDALAAASARASKKP